MNAAVRPPFFILCPLRSFSSLVCGMLGQHPDFLGLPELNLFLDDYVSDLHRKLRRRGRAHATNGVLRALAELQFGGQSEANVDEAQHWLNEADRSCQDVCDHIIALASPKAIIDKSPATVMKPEHLDRMYEMYPDAFFLHLTRHPRPTCKSMIDLVSRNSEWGGKFDSERMDPENVWLQAHTNIVEFCSSLPLGQSMRIQGEQLLSNLEIYLPQIFEWLEARTDAEALEEVMHPERSPFACEGPPNAKYGNDPNFLANPALRRGQVKTSTLEGPLDWNPEAEFRPETLKLAREFGYQ